MQWIKDKNARWVKDKKKQRFRLFYEDEIC